MSVFLIILVVLILFILIRCIRVVPQQEQYIIERLGVYSATWSPGLHIKIPFIEKVVNRTSLKEQVFDVDSFQVITKDNVGISVDAVIFFRVMDSKLFTYGVSDAIVAIQMLCNTLLRNIFGSLELDESLTSRETINSQLTAELDKATDAWGIKISRVELKNLTPPRDISEAMEKQMRAERQKRAQILEAEGNKQAAITEAQGEKESAILRAEARKQQQILEAEGEAAAILAVKKAEAQGYNMLAQVVDKDGVIKLQGFDAFKEMADGQSTKMIVPANMSDLASNVATISDVLSSVKHKSQKVAPEERVNK